MNSNGIFSQIFFQGFWVLGVTLIAIAFLVGILLLLVPAKMLRVADYLNREYPTSWLTRALDRPRNIEPFIYRHHYVSGLLLAIGSVYFLWQAGTVFMPPLIDPLLYGVLIVINLIAFFLGLVIFVRPSLLKSVEHVANRWISTQATAERIEKRKLGKPEMLAHRYPRVFGAVILAAVLYMILMVISLT